MIPIQGMLIRLRWGEYFDGRFEPGIRVKQVDRHGGLIGPRTRRRQRAAQHNKKGQAITPGLFQCTTALAQPTSGTTSHASPRYSLITTICALRKKLNSVALAQV